MKRTIALVMACLCTFLVVEAQDLTLKTMEPSIDLTSYWQLLEDENGEFEASDFLEASSFSFQQYKDRQGQTRPDTYYWARLVMRNQLPEADRHQEWVMYLSNTLTDVKVFTIDSKGKIFESRTGLFTPYREKTFRPAADHNYAKIILPPNEQVTILVKARSQRSTISPRFVANLSHTDQFYTHRLKRKWANALFLGIVLMMLIYNVILWWYAKDRTYGYYSGYLVAIATYFAYTRGDLVDWLTPLLFYGQPRTLFLIKIVIYLGLISYLAFIRFFLDLPEMMPKWDRIFKWLMILGAPLLLLDVILLVTSNFSYVYSDYVSMVYTGVFIITSLIFLLPLYKLNDKKRYFIIFGIISMSLGFFLTIGERLWFHSFTMIPFKVGTTLEIVAFSLGLAYRQRQNEREKQRARFELERSKLIQEKEHAEKLHLEKLNEMKNRFYANITHEFRTPLTVIKGMVNEIEGNAQAKKLILRNSRNLERLINQILDLSKLESGKLTLDLIQSDIVVYLRYLTESMRSFAHTKNIQIRFFDEEKEPLIMDFDEEKLQHIIYNLLSNALKFTPDDGVVSLHVKKETTADGAFAQIRVKDTGIGIEEEDRVRIFERFYQADNHETNSQSGTGIGLALTKDLVDLMNGRIKVESTPGTGSEFIVRLPITNEAPKTEPAELLQELTAEETNGEEVPVFVSSDEEEDKPLLLIIEDNQDVVAYVQSLLKDHYVIEIALNGKIGVEKAIEKVPDIIISDVMMPVKNGFEVCQELKTDERTSHIPIILLTAKAGDEDMMEGLEKGADAYLTKPFNKIELFHRLKNLINLRKNIQHHYSVSVPDGKDTKEDKEPTLEDIFLQNLRSVVEEKIDDPELAILDLCRKVNLGHTQVYRKLKALTDKTPSQFIRSIRLHKAKELLESSDLNVSEIAYDVGFSDPNYFSRTFNEEFGMPPSAIRK